MLTSALPAPHRAPRRRPNRHSLLPRIPLQRRLLPLPQWLLPRNRPLHPYTRHRRRRPLAACPRLHTRPTLRRPRPRNPRPQENPPHTKHRPRRNRIRKIRVWPHKDYRREYQEASGGVLGNAITCAASRGGNGVQEHVSRVPAVWFRRAEFGAG